LREQKHNYPAFLFQRSHPLKQRERQWRRKNKIQSEKKKKKPDWGLRLSFLILGAQLLGPAFAAPGCTDRVPGVAVHADLHVE
jgi:hypothetical protein